MALRGGRSLGHFTHETTCTNTGVMPTRGHDGKGCARLSTNVGASEACHARTLLAAEGQSLYIDNWISCLAGCSRRRLLRFDWQNVCVSRVEPVSIFGKAV